MFIFKKLILFYYFIIIYLIINFDIKFIINNNIYKY